jgi:hypothetical protein
MMVLYKIWDEGDSDYEPWYGDVKEIKNYLADSEGVNADYDPKKDWKTNLENYGLSFEIVKSRR